MNLPNFIIIGAMKAGTTALYQYLKQHPQIYMSPVKETNFFLRDHKNLEEYTAFFKGVSNKTKAIGEASPGYLARSRAYERIARYLPKIKLIAILRNPADRAYSHFLMKYRQELRSVHDKEIINCFFQKLQKDKLLIEEGLYYKYLKLYLNFFPREQLKICLYENLKLTPDALIRDIFCFLGVDENYKFDNLDTYYNKGGRAKNQFLHNSVNSLKKKYNSFLRGLISEETNLKIHKVYNGITNSNLVQYPKLKPENRQQLIQVNRQDILQLQELIQHDLSTWMK